MTFNKLAIIIVLLSFCTPAFADFDPNAPDPDNKPAADIVKIKSNFDHLMSTIQYQNNSQNDADATAVRLEGPMSSTPAASPETGKFFYNTVTNTFNIYDSTVGDYVPVGSHIANRQIDCTTTTAKFVGEACWDIDDESAYFYSGTSWVSPLSLTAGVSSVNVSGGAAFQGAVEFNASGGISVSQNATTKQITYTLGAQYGYVDVWAVDNGNSNAPSYSWYGSSTDDTLGAFASEFSDTAGSQDTQIIKLTIPADMDVDSDAYIYADCFIPSAAGASENVYLLLDSSWMTAAQSHTQVVEDWAACSRSTNPYTVAGGSLSYVATIPLTLTAANTNYVAGSPASFSIKRDADSDSYGDYFNILHYQFVYTKE